MKKGWWGGRGGGKQGLVAVFRVALNFIPQPFVLSRKVLPVKKGSLTVLLFNSGCVCEGERYGLLCYTALSEGT